MLRCNAASRQGNAAHLWGESSRCWPYLAGLQKCFVDDFRFLVFRGVHSASAICDGVIVLDRGTKSLHEPNDPAFETVLERVVAVNVSPCGFCPR